MTTQAANLQTFYCHGLPGSSEEISKFRKAAEVTVLAPLDLGGVDLAMSSHDKAQVHLIGFSLGAMTTLQIAAQRPDKIAKITLIAPAAPLESGDFLPHMAGRPVFTAAQKGPLVFKLFTTLQKIGLRFASKQIISTMFADSPKADKILLEDPHFKNTLLKGLKDSFGQNRHPYERAILAYVKPWSVNLADIASPVTIYHGTQDNWAPIEMAYALKKQITSDVDIIPLDGLGHYSALQKAFPLIFSASNQT